MALRKLVPMNYMLADAEKGGYAVGAFNINDMAGVQAVVQAAEEERSPVIIQMYTSGIDLVGARYIAAVAETAAQNSNVPVVLHLDHGSDLEAVRACIEAGFSSVMIDCSKLPLAENMEITQKAVQMAHAAGISAEAELGKVGSGSQEMPAADKQRFLTDPEEARQFVEQTGVDALAIAIGSAHGLYEFTPDLDFDRLKAIQNSTETYLVLHGGSDLPEDQIRRAVKLGITKINVATDLSGAYSAALRKVVAASQGIIWPGRVFGAVREAMKELIRERIRLFGSSGMAD